MPRVRNMGYDAVRTDRWKYVHYTELSGMDVLYDLKRDPYELENVIAGPPAAGSLAAITAEWKRLRREIGPRPSRAG